MPQSPTGSGPDRPDIDDSVPETGTTDRHSSVRERVMALVEPMPLAAVHELYCRIEPLDELDPEGLIAVKSAFVNHLNKFRPQRARRLFSEMFVPIWTNDPIMARSRRPVPGLVLHMDVAALWRLLSRAALANLAKKAQTEIDRLADTMLINEAMAAPVVKAIGDAMRETTVRALDQALANAANTRTVLENLNKLRAEETRPVAGRMEEPVPVDREFLVFVRSYLANRDVCAEAVRESAGLAAAPPENATVDDEEYEREAEALLEASERLLDDLDVGGRTSPLAWLLPLIHLNVRRRYAPVAHYLRESGGAGPRGDPLSSALLGHFEGCCRTVVGVLEAALRIDERASGASVRITRREKTAVDDALKRLEEIIPAIQLGGIQESRHTGPQVQQPWTETTAFFARRLTPLVGQRATVAATSRLQATVDHQDVSWLIRLIWSWWELSRKYEIGDTVYFVRWRTRMMEDVRFALDRAARFEEGELPSQRMEHLLRLHDLASAMDLTISPYLSVSSPNIVRMISDAIASDQKMTDAKRELVRGFVDRVRDELRKSKRWQSPELASLVELAEGQGL